MVDVPVRLARGRKSGRITAFESERTIVAALATARLPARRSERKNYGVTRVHGKAS